MMNNYIDIAEELEKILKEEVELSIQKEYDSIEKEFKIKEFLEITNNNYELLFNMLYNKYTQHEFTKEFIAYFLLNRYEESKFILDILKSERNEQ